MTIFNAEIGLNHLGDEERAMQLLIEAVEAGANGVTFQIQSPSYYDGSRPFRVALPKSFYKSAASMANKMGVQFGLAIHSADVLKEHSFSNVNFWKILSMEFANDQLVKAAVDSGRYTYLSTGVSSLEEIQIKAKKYKDINFVHTTLSEKVADANISAIDTIKKTINNDISFGLHSIDIRVAMLAMTFDLHSIFFYIKSIEALDYPDNLHAIEINKLRDCITDWNFAITALGDGNKSIKNIPNWVYE